MRKNLLDLSRGYFFLLFYVDYRLNIGRSSTGIMSTVDINHVLSMIHIMPADGRLKLY